MTHYVGPRATYTATSGHEACVRCGGRGSLRYAPTGRHVSRSYYGETAFWRTCSRCGGTGHTQE